MPSHSSQGPRQQGLSPGPTASHPKGHLKRNLKRLTKVIIKPLMHMVSDFLRKKMTHIRTYAKKLAEGKDLLPLLQWRHSQQPQTQTSACSLSLWASGPFTQQEGQGQAAGFLLQAAPGVPTDTENTLRSRAAHAKEKWHQLLSWHFKNDLQSTDFQNRLEVRTWFLWNTTWIA